MSEPSAADFVRALVALGGLAAFIATPFAVLLWVDRKNHELDAKETDRFYTFLERTSAIDRQRLNESGLWKMDSAQLESIAAAVATEIRRRKTLAEVELWYAAELNDMTNMAQKPQ